MQLELLLHTGLDSTAYAQFSPGPYYQTTFWSEDAVYMEADAFMAVCYLVGHFDLFGPETLSGSRLQRCIDDLEAAAKRVSKAENPKEVWDHAISHGFGEFMEVESWRLARHDFGRMLLDLAVWMRSVQAKGQPVTCLGL